MSRAPAAGKEINFVEEKDTEVTAMTASWKRNLVPTFIVLLGLFSLAVSGVSGDHHLPGKGTTAATFYVA
ncbi:MAG: hypothetical protein HKM29_02245 [Deltaproteobacteria bacterium]|nr:hypothetical protein [Deltaproteobacteria bacterium]